MADGAANANNLLWVALLRYGWLTNKFKGLTMKELAVYEAKTRLFELWVEVEVEKREQFIITRRGRGRGLLGGRGAVCCAPRLRPRAT